jgi:prepilin-type N-terminal cleavage/methylation domain-containing protein
MLAEERRNDTIARVKARGFGLIEILIVLAVVALAGYLLMQYVNSSAKTAEQLRQERPIDRSKLAADRATLSSMQSVVRTYQAEKGEWPPDRTAVLALLMAAPKFQCAGNDFDYDAATGALRLTITDDTRC